MSKVTSILTWKLMSFSENRKFDVTHDADTSFNLVLEPYFSYMNETDGKIGWILRT